MLATAALSIAAVSGLLKPKVALAASGLKDVFRTSTGRDALQALFPDQTLTRPMSCLQENRDALFR